MGQHRNYFWAAYMYSASPNETVTPATKGGPIYFLLPSLIGACSKFFLIGTR